MQDLELLFVNMYNLINSLRAHQARETLIETMQQQVGRRKADVLALQEQAQAVAKQIHDAHAALAAASGPAEQQQ